MKKIILFLTIIIFASCDPGILNIYVVDNKTDFDLKIESKLNSGHRNPHEKDSVKLITIKPQSESIVVEYFAIGTAHDQGSNFLKEIDTIIIKNKVLKKDIYERKNWNYKILKKGLLTEDKIEYKLTLTNSDFE